MKLRVPVQPVLDHINRHGGDMAVFFEQEEVEGADGELDFRIVAHEMPRWERQRKRVSRGADQGWLDLFMADDICIDVFGLHPALVFGRDWWDYPNDKALQDRLAGREEVAA